MPANDWGLAEGNTRSDAFALSHFGVLDGYDCQGNHVGKPTLIRDSYQVNNKQELTCKDTLSAVPGYQAIAEGVEDFQLLYAERSKPNFKRRRAVAMEERRSNCFYCTGNGD